MALGILVDFDRRMIGLEGRKAVIKRRGI